MATRVFYAGQTIRLSGTFTNAAGTLVDPTTVVITVRDPAGGITTPAVTRDSAGAYHADIAAALGDTDALWTWKLQGTGANPQLEFSEFKVLPAPF